jgi:hypothetical protein
MVLVLLWLIFRPRKLLRCLPRSPNTLAAVLIYLASREDKDERETESMLGSMRGLSVVNTDERDEFLKRKGCLYGLGLVAGDGLRIDDDRRVERL